MTDRDALLKRLRAFAEQQNAADKSADRDTLARGADIVTLYEDRSWVGEMDAAHPIKRSAVHRRPPDPESFSRFTRWLAERVPIAGRTAYQLRDAHELTTNYLRQAQIIPTGERQIRPLKWFQKNDHADRIPEVWALAVEMAGGRAPDAPTVRRAISQWRADNLPRSVTKTAQKRSVRAREDRWVEEGRRLLHEDPSGFAKALGLIEDEAEALIAEVQAN
jgi:hypothetical protein